VQGSQSTISCRLQSIWTISEENVILPGYLIGDESFESEEFFKAYYFQGAMLEKRNNSL